MVTRATSARRPSSFGWGTARLTLSRRHESVNSPGVVALPTHVRKTQDWMSLFQNYTGDLIAAATRTAEQQKMFDRCMGTMHLWYGNAHIHIWMMSVVPSYATRKYDERGWCKFEKRVGGIITPSHMALDLGLMKLSLIHI